MSSMSPEPVALQLEPVPTEKEATASLPNPAR